MVREILSCTTQGRRSALPSQAGWMRSVGREYPTERALRLLAASFLLAVSITIPSFLVFSIYATRIIMATAPPGTVRFVIVSDTHRSLPAPIPHGDVLIHAGDSEMTAAEMDTWARSLPHPHKVFVAGNMDRRLEAAAGEELKHAVYLQDRMATVAGLNIYGSPWTPKFVGVFQMDGETAAERIWGQMPSAGVDVLVTHGPARGILDRTSRGYRVGDDILRRRVLGLKPRLHCFGHVHESYGTSRVGETLFCNAAVYNGHPPIVVDVPTNKSKPATLV